VSHLETPLSETHSKTYLHCEKCKKQEYMRMLEPCMYSFAKPCEGDACRPLATIF
jgi:hypothetical protein